MLAIFLIFLIFIPSQVSHAGVKATTCLKTENEWIDWRDKIIESIGFFSLHNVSDDQFKMISNRSSIIETCEEEPGNWLSENLGNKSSLSPLEVYLINSLLHLKSDSSGGHYLNQTVQNHNHDPASTDSYGHIASQKLQFPDWTESKEFSEALLQPNFSVLVPYLNALKQSTGSTIRYARFKGYSFGAQSPEDRLTIYVPGEQEKFVLIKQSEEWHAGDADPPGTKPCAHYPCVNEVAILGMQSQGNNFITYLRETSLPSSTKPNQSFISPGDCFNCHASGAIAIHGVIDQSDQPTVDFINERIKQANGNWDGNNFFQKLGPTYGSLDARVVANRSDDNFKMWSNGKLIIPDSITRVRNAMNCAKCHDGETRAILTKYNSELLKRYVLSGIMPPKAVLSNDERQALYDSLNAEYDFSFQAWLAPASPSSLIIDYLKGH